MAADNLFRGEVIKAPVGKLPKARWKHTTRAVSVLDRTPLFIATWGMTYRFGLGRDARVNALLGAGHFRSHFYQLCLPLLFIAWQKTFDVSLPS
jgi:hypothetical protein